MCSVTKASWNIREREPLLLFPGFQKNVLPKLVSYVVWENRVKQRDFVSWYGTLCILFTDYSQNTVNLLSSNEFLSLDLFTVHCISGLFCKPS